MLAYFLRVIKTPFGRNVTKIESGKAFDPFIPVLLAIKSFFFFV
jgi:hypothetical protein